MRDRQMHGLENAGQKIQGVKNTGPESAGPSSLCELNYKQHKNNLSIIVYIILRCSVVITLPLL